MFYPELRGNPLDAYNRMVAKLYDKAKDELGLSEEELVLRPLRPEDIGLTIPVWKFTDMSANAWGKVIDNKAIADARFVGICGIFHNETYDKVSQIRIKRMASDVRYWDPMPVLKFEHQTGWADDPVTVDQNTTITVEMYTRTTSTMYEFAFMGAVVEKKGLLVHPE